MQVDMHNVKAHIAGANNAHYRVQVCAVVIEQTACLVNDVGNLLNIALKQTEGGGVGEHQTRSVGADCCTQRVKINAAVGSGFDFFNFEAAHNRTCGVGAVRCIGNDDGCAGGVAAMFVIGADMHKSGQFTVRTGSGLERESVHAADFAQAFFHVIHQAQRTLAHICIEQRMHIVKQLGDFFVDFGVIFHRAGAERIEPVVNAEIAAGKVCVVANKIDFTQFGKVEF